MEIREIGDNYQADLDIEEDIDAQLEEYDREVAKRIEEKIRGRNQEGLGVANR